MKKTQKSKSLTWLEKGHATADLPASTEPTLWAIDLMMLLWIVCIVLVAHCMYYCVDQHCFLQNIWWAVWSVGECYSWNEMQVCCSCWQQLLQSRINQVRGKSSQKQCPDGRNLKSYVVDSTPKTTEDEDYVQCQEQSKHSKLTSWGLDGEVWEDTSTRLWTIPFW